jgi:hypothetical protein
MAARGLQNRWRGAVKASWVGSIPIHPRQISPRFARNDSQNYSQAASNNQTFKQAGEPSCAAAHDPQILLAWVLADGGNPSHTALGRVDGHRVQLRPPKPDPVAVMRNPDVTGFEISDDDTRHVWFRNQE